MRRLQVPTSAAPGGQVLPGVGRPEDQPGGRCRLARVLVATLRSAGHRVTYDAVLGLSGIAALPPPELGDPGDDALWEAYPSLAAPSEVPAPAPCEALPRWVAAVLGAVGARGEVRSGLCDPAAVMEAVREGIGGGLPVPLLGWPEGEADWALVTGHDPSRGVICGWPPDREAETYLGAPPAGRAAVVLQAGPATRPQPADSAQEALGRWPAGRELTRQRYQSWLGWLEGCDETAMPRHHAVTEALADARLAAAAFVGTCAAVLGEGQAVPELEAATDHLTSLVETLEDGPAAPEGEGHDPVAWREGWSEALATAYRHEHATRECIREALELLNHGTDLGT